MKYCFFLLSFFVSYSQINYKPSYYVSKDGKKIEGYVLDSNIIGNDFILFKKAISDIESKINIVDFSELVVDNQEKYISTNIDYTINRLNESSLTINEDMQPKYASKFLLLRVLVEGEVSLYTTEIQESAFFYVKEINSEKLINLVYYKYRDSDNEIDEYNLFKRQLFKLANCGPDSSFVRFNSLKYFEKDLIKTINDFNVCKKGITDDYSIKIKKNKLKYYFLAGVKRKNISFNKSTNFLGQIPENTFYSPTIGFETSILLPTKSNQFEIFFRVEFDRINYNSRTETPYPNSNLTIFYEEIKFKSNFIGFIVGTRYSFNKSIFIKGATGLSVPFSDDFRYFSVTVPVWDTYKKLDLNSSLNFNLGLGYLINKKYSLEFSYSSASSYLNFTNFNNKVSSLDLIFRYSLNNK